MRMQLLPIGVGLITLLVACGGGGGGEGRVLAGPGPVTSSLSFPAASAYATLVANGIATKNFTISGNCSGTASLARTPAVGGATFESIGGRFFAVSTATVNFTNCLPASSTATTTIYYDTSYIPLGTVAAGNYGVYLTPPALPSSVMVGNTGTFGTLTYYTDSTRAVFAGQSVESYIVEPDTATTAIVNLITKNYNASNVLTLTEQDRYRIAATGAPALVSIDTQAANGSTIHLIFQ